MVVETIHKFTTDRKALVEAQTTSAAAAAGGGAGVYSEQQPMRVRCYIFIGLFLFGGIVQLVTVFIAKYSVGKSSCCLGGAGEGVGITVAMKYFCSLCIRVYAHQVAFARTSYLSASRTGHWLSVQMNAATNATSTKTSVRKNMHSHSQIQGKRV